MRDPSQFQVIWVTLVAIGFIAIYFFEMIYERDDWPFSAYSMFSGLRSKRRKVPRLYGVVRDSAGERELMLVDKQYLLPFNRGRLGVAFKKLLRKKSSQADIQIALQDCYCRYEDRRQRRLHSGPSLVGLRVYWTEWEILPFAQNRNCPENKELAASWIAPPSLLTVPGTKGTGS